MNRCLHQIVRPSRRNLSKQDGVGECLDCQPDENNKYCKCYTPVCFTIVEIKNEEGDE